MKQQAHKVEVTVEEVKESTSSSTAGDARVKVEAEATADGRARSTPPEGRDPGAATGHHHRLSAAGSTTPPTDSRATHGMFVPCAIWLMLYRASMHSVALVDGKSLPTSSLSITPAW